MKTLKIKKGGSAKLAKQTQKTLSDAKKVKKKTETAVKHLDKAIHKFTDTLNKIAHGVSQKKRKKQKKVKKLNYKQNQKRVWI